jgi:hypothetical protein
MSDLPTCPCCGGILDVPAHYTLTSACRCGFPEKVDWSEFPPRDQLTEVHGDPLKRRRAA